MEARLKLSRTRCGAHSPAERLVWGQGWARALSTPTLALLTTWVSG